jgi:pimeloyl-ACP methyl ester carboxylesterase
LWDEAHRKFEAGRDQTFTSAQEKNDWKLFMLDWTQPHISLDDLHKIRCPSLIICGDHDIISIPHTVLIFQNIPHANLWVVPNCGHATLREHAAEFNDMCIRFFTEPFSDHPYFNIPATAPSTTRHSPAM